MATRLNLEVELVRVVIRVYFGAPDAVLPVFGMNIPKQNELWAQASSEATKYLAGKVEQLRASGPPMSHPC